MTEATPYKMIDTWEYDILGLPLNDEAFDALGSAGWELVCWLPSMDAQGNRLFIFKHHLLVQDPTAPAPEAQR
jgi:hypothetical protein